LDEIFKANSAILNALLGLLNERQFDNGSERVRVPLISAVGASNELPDGSELAALHDRFLVRCYVDPVSADRFGELLQIGDARAPNPAEDDRLTLAELAFIQAQSRSVRVSGGVEHALALMKTWLSEKRLYVSDRRWVKIVGLLRVAASTEGREMVLLPDLELLVHCVWDKPEQAAVVRDSVAAANYS
jgi:MoxR-like ATPase